MLANAMEATRCLGAPWEWFSDTFSKTYDKSVATTMDRCALLLSKGVTPNTVGGVKIFPSQFKLVISDIDWNEWFPSCKWLRLRRRDRVRQAISLVIARQGDSWTSQEKRHRPLVYDRKQIDACLRELAVEEEFWDRYFADSMLSPPTFWYEDIVGSLTSTVSAIAEYVGVSLLRSAPSADAISFKRQADATNEQWCIRFLEEEGGSPTADRCA